MRKRDKVCYKEDNGSILDSSLSSFKNESKSKKKGIAKAATKNSKVPKCSREINNHNRIQSLFEILNKSKEAVGVKGRMLELQMKDLESDYSSIFEGQIDGLLIDFDWRRLGFEQFVCIII